MEKPAVRGGGTYPNGSCGRGCINPIDRSNYNGHGGGLKDAGRRGVDLQRTF
jgi:hypothetical protein